MMLSERVQAFLELERQTCQLLEPASVQALALAATRFYAGYGHLDVVKYKPEAPPPPAPAPAPDVFSGVFDVSSSAPKRLIDPNNTAGPIPPVDPALIIDDAEVTESDWAIIRPLFLLYVEREQALMQEATRVMGADPFGRSSSEIASDINTYEAELGRKAFIQPVLSI